MTNIMSVRGVATIQQEYAIIGAQAGGLRTPNPSQYIISGLTESDPIFGRIVAYLQELNSLKYAVALSTVT
jgi:hypothetical protein